MNAFLTTLVLSAGLLAAPDARQRPALEVRIDEHPIRLALDTGAETLLLFSHAADRIGLGYHKPEKEFDPARKRPGEVAVFPSDVCRLRIGATESDGRLLICEIPPAGQSPGIDGVLGWANLATGILYINWGQRVFTSLSAVPALAPPWRGFDLYSSPSVHILALRVSRTPGLAQAVYVDTGDPDGVGVTSATWDAIVSRHPGLPTAIRACYTPGIGHFVRTICWIKELKLGGIELHDVPVHEAPKGFQQWPSYLATIGLYGLTRLELIVDGRHNRAHVRARKDYPQEYDYNRLGAVFLPSNSPSQDLVATVLTGSPADKAGVRNGDRLLQVDGNDVTAWATDPNVMTRINTLFAQPAGTELRLTIVRDACPEDVSVILQETLPIKAGPTSRQESRG